MAVNLVFIFVAVLVSPTLCEVTMTQGQLNDDDDDDNDGGV